MPLHRTDLSCAEEAEQVMRDPKSEECKGLNRSLWKTMKRLAYLEPKVTTMGDMWIILSTLLSLTLF